MCPAPSALTWATDWIGLQGQFNVIEDNFPETYLAALNAITSQVVLPNLCADSQGNPISCISQIRTNEILLSPFTQNQGFWELREFHYSQPNSTPTLTEAPIAQTPDPSFNTSGKPLCGVVNNGLCAPSGSLGNYLSFIGLNPIFQSTQGAAPPVPDNWPPGGPPLLGGSALNNQAWWNDADITYNPQDVTRIDFSANTCSGCHGREAQTVFFQHVVRRTDTTESGLSFFLAGNPVCPTSLVNMVGTGTSTCTETVLDPNPAFEGPPPLPVVHTTFGDLLRRVAYLQTVCGSFSNNECSGGTGDDLLLPFTNKPIGVH